MNITFTTTPSGDRCWEATPDLVDRRLFADDDHAPTTWIGLADGGPFALAASYGSFRPEQGLFVTAQARADGATDTAVAEAEAWYHQTHIPDLLAVRGVTGCQWFQDEAGRTIRLYGLDVDPLDFHEDLAARTPGMAMVDLRPAYRTLIVGAYRSADDSIRPGSSPVSSS